MTLKRIAMQRKFTYDGRPLADPDPNLSIDEVRQHYAGAYPALNNASYEQDATDKAVEINFTTAAGSKG